MSSGEFCDIRVVSTSNIFSSEEYIILANFVVPGIRFLDNWIFVVEFVIIFTRVRERFRSMCKIGLRQA